MFATYAIRVRLLTATETGPEPIFTTLTSPFGRMIGTQPLAVSTTYALPVLRAYAIPDRLISPEEARESCAQVLGQAGNKNGSHQNEASPAVRMDDLVKCVTADRNIPFETISRTNFRQN